MRFIQPPKVPGRVFLTLLLGVCNLTPVHAQPPSALPRPDHIVIVIEENHSYSQIVGSADAPYINSLVAQGASFTRSFGVGHPSQPNYLVLFSGSAQQVIDNSCPHIFSAPNLRSKLNSTGLTFGGYSEDLPATGSRVCETGAYARKHNPWVNWQEASVNAVPSVENLPFALFPTDFTKLPTVSIVVPNNYHNMHDGADPERVRRGDEWLREHLDPYIQWARDKNSLFILTWDEGDLDHEDNRVPTIVVGPMVRPGQSSERITHVNVLRTLEAMYGLSDSVEDVKSPPILKVWTPGMTSRP